MIPKKSAIVNPNYCLMGPSEKDSFYQKELNLKIVQKLAKQLESRLFPVCTRIFLSCRC